MKSKLCVLLLGILAMAGCTRTARFFPVQGPLSAQTPPPVAVGRISAASLTQTRGDVAVVLADGEAFKGKWELVPRGQTLNRADAKVAALPGMQPEWDAVYGEGYYVAHVLGIKLYARSTIAGDRGGKLDVEFYKSGNELAGNVAVSILKGVAKDNPGDIYKVLLQ